MLGLVLGFTPAGAQVVDASLWCVGPGTSVNAIARSGNTLYIGGSFGSVGPSTGAGAPVDVKDGAPAGPYPAVAGDVATVVADGSGGWFVGGAFAGVGGFPRRNLAHILADGAVADWNPSPDGTIVALAMSGNTLYVGGDFWQIGGEARRSLAAFDVSTGHVTAWDPEPGAGGPTGSEYGTVWAILPRGHNVYVGGSFASIGGESRMNLAALDAKTGTATAWNPGADSGIRALAIHGNTLFAGGLFVHMGEQLRTYLAAIDLGTGAATPWDARVSRVPEDYNYDGGPRVLALQVLGNTLYVAGAFSEIGGQPRASLAALDIKTGAATSWDPQAHGWGTEDPARPYFNTLVVHENTIYVGGEFRTLGGRDGGSDGVGYAGAVDARTGLATPWNPRPNGGVVALAASGNAIYVGGWFNSLRDWVPRSGLAALDVTTGAATPWDPGCDGLVRSLAASGSTVYVAGQFSTVGGKARANLAALDATDGTARDWSPNPNGPLWTVVVSGSTVYAGGWFGRIAGQPRGYAAALDSATGAATAWDPGANDIVNTLAVSGGTVYAGGWFSRIGGQQRRSIAALDAATGAATSWNPDGDGVVQALAVGGSTVYAGGIFWTIGGESRNCLAALDVSTGTATLWNPDPGPDPVVPGPDILALAVSGTTVYVGGIFGSMSGQPRRSIAAFDAKTGSVLPWNADADRLVAALAGYGNTIYAGGIFRRMGTAPTSGLAAITAAIGNVVKERAVGLLNPQVLALAQNFPNPARSNTSIRFLLPVSGPVNLEVYDVQGRHVASLLDHELRPAGEQEVPVRTEGWRAGCYFYRLEAGGRSETRKMLVVR